MIRNLIIAFVALLLALLLLYPLANAQAQEHHAQHHPYYNNWVNQQDKGCCNNQDCGELSDADERTTGGILAVKVDGEWCPVLPHHYLKRGNAPDASVSHACIQNYKAASGNACDRLLCYQPKPGS